MTARRWWDQLPTAVTIVITALLVVVNVVGLIAVYVLVSNAE